MNYSEKLKSPLWQRKRLQILERDNWTCQYCGDTEKNLQVHHLKYSKSGNPWDVGDKDLITTCCKCHTVISIYPTGFDIFSIDHNNKDSSIDYSSIVFHISDGDFTIGICNTVNGKVDSVMNVDVKLLEKIIKVNKKIASDYGKRPGISLLHAGLRYWNNVFNK